MASTETLDNSYLVIRTAFITKYRLRN